MKTILDENIGGCLPTIVHLKVRTNFSDDSFNITRVDGMFEGSLHMLIHRIMYVEKHYLRFLDSFILTAILLSLTGSYTSKELGKFKDGRLNNFKFPIPFTLIFNSKASLNFI